MVVDHHLCEGFDLGARRLVESHAAELDLRHVLACHVMHKLAVALQVRAGPARADCGAAFCRRLGLRRLRTFGVRAAADDDDDGSDGHPQQTGALHQILPFTQMARVPTLAVVQRECRSCDPTIPVSGGRVAARGPRRPGHVAAWLSGGALGRTMWRTSHAACSGQTAAQMRLRQG